MEPPGKGQRYLSKGNQFSLSKKEFAPRKTDVYAINMDEILGKKM